MKALVWNGVNDLRVERVPDPGLLEPQDAIVRVHLSSVCGSDLHLIDGYVPAMRAGDIIGHEFIGEVVETGREVHSLKRGDRVIVVSVIGCGHCWYCDSGLWSLCDNSNPKPHAEQALYGHATSGIFGYSHAFGGFAGSHADYVRVPFADQGAFKVPEGLSDEQALFVSDAFPTGYMAADLCSIRPGDVVAVWGCGGVGLMAIHSAYLLGAEQVIAIDRIPERLRLAAEQAGAHVLNYEQTDVTEEILALTGGRGPDACIDAVGMEADTTGPRYWYDRAKQAARLETDRPYVLRDAIRLCRKGGTVSVIGVYGGVIAQRPAARPALRPPAVPAYPGRRCRSVLSAHPPAATGSGARRLSPVQDQAGRLPAGGVPAQLTAMPRRGRAVARARPDRWSAPLFSEKGQHNKIRYKSCSPDRASGCVPPASGAGTP